MNLRQQFFWKILLGISVILSLLLIYSSYNKFSKYREYKLAYEKETQVVGNKIMEQKTDSIASFQLKRLNFIPNLSAISQKSITNHIRAGIKLNSKANWGSKDPVYKGAISKYCLIEYRDASKEKYQVGEKIEGTEMIIKSFNKDCVILKEFNESEKIICTKLYLSRINQK